MRPDAFFDVRPYRRLSDSERLDYLDSLTSPQGRVILHLDEDRGWSLKETVLLEGRIGARHAIDDFALEQGYRPPPGARHRAHEALVLSLCFFAVFLLLVAIACPYPAPDLREVELAAPPPNRGSGEPNAERRTAPASREKPSASVVVPWWLRGPVQLDGPVLLSTVPARSHRRTLSGRTHPRPMLNRASPAPLGGARDREGHRR